MIRASSIALLALLSTACAETPKTAQAAPATERSLLLAQVPQRSSSDLPTTVQRRLLGAPALSGRVATHGWSGPDLYSVEFEGSCAAHADLVAGMEAVLRANGASRTSCVPATIFAPGEPIIFRPSGVGE